MDAWKEFRESIFHGIGLVLDPIEIQHYHELMLHDVTEG